MFSDKQLNNFWSKIDVCGVNKCWNWQGYIEPAGYGQTCKKKRAHQLAFFIYNGYIPEKPLLIRHICDNRSCCNPFHLIEGTAEDNSHDMVTRGRASIKPDRRNNKLQWNDIIYIRSLLEKNIYTQRFIAKMFNVSDTTISEIKTNKIWSI